MAVMLPEMKEAVRGLTVLAQASWKDLEFWSLHTFPIALPHHRSHRISRGERTVQCAT